MTDHVTVIERVHPGTHRRARPVGVDVRKWFEENTHRRMHNRLEDGSDLDVEQYVEHYIDVAAGEADAPRLFRELLPSSRDVTTALLLDGSSSLGAHGGQIFTLELACADALSRAMASARERHGIFVFTGNTRHRVEVSCLKDFGDRRIIAPGGLGLSTGGYTRLGAPLRHLTSRLLAQPAERRQLIVIGDGLISDEGYEGALRLADSAHAVEEARDAGVAMYYIASDRYASTRCRKSSDPNGPSASAGSKNCPPVSSPTSTRSWLPREYRYLLRQRQRGSAVRAGLPPAAARHAHRPDGLR